MKWIKYCLLFILGFSFFGVHAQTNLDIQVSSPSFGSVPRNAVRLPLLYIQIQSPTATKIQSITLKRHGLSTSEDFGHIWAASGYKRTLRSSLHNDDTVEVRFRSGLPITANNPTNITIYGNLNNLRNGNTFSFSVEGIKHTPLSSYSFPKRTPERVISSPVTQSPSYTKRKPRIRCIRGKCQRLY